MGGNNLEKQPKKPIFSSSTSQERCAPGTACVDPSLPQQDLTSLRAFEDGDLVLCERSLWSADRQVGCDSASLQTHRGVPFSVVVLGSGSQASSFPTYFILPLRLPKRPGLPNDDIEGKKEDKGISCSTRGNTQEKEHRAIAQKERTCQAVSSTPLLLS